MIDHKGPLRKLPQGQKFLSAAMDVNQDTSTNKIIITEPYEDPEVEVKNVCSFYNPFSFLFLPPKDY